MLITLPTILFLLAVADFLTGLYLLVVAVKDIQFRGEFQLQAYTWMHSASCSALGILAVLAAEVKFKFRFEIQSPKNLL